MGKKLVLPDAADIVDYSQCNANCIHCSRGGIIRKSKPIDKEKIIEAIKSLKTLGIKKFNFSGGEPVRTKGIEEFINCASDDGNVKNVSIDTNGYWGFEAEKRLKEFYDNGVRKIVLSLDGVKTTHDYHIRKHPGLYMKVMHIIKTANMKRMKGEKIPHIRINMTAQPANVNELELLLNMIPSPETTPEYSLGLSFATQFGNAADLKLKEKQIEQVKEIKKRFKKINADISNPYQYRFDTYVTNSRGCQKAYYGDFTEGKHTVMLSLDGNVYLCPTFSPPFALTLGNVAEKSVEEVFDGYFETDFYKWLARADGCTKNKERNKILKEIDTNLYKDMRFPNYCVMCSIASTYIHFKEIEGKSVEEANIHTAEIVKPENPPKNPGKHI